MQSGANHVEGRGLETKPAESRRGQLSLLHDPSKCWELANEPKSTVSKSIGLGPAERVDVFTDVPINFYITIVEGAGIK